MTGRRKHEDYIQQPRRDRMYEEHLEDPYLERGKPAEPAVCPDCGAVFHKGRWQWSDAPEAAHEHRCPACSRIHDRIPAAILTLSGEFFATNRQEIMRLIHSKEEREKAEHPLERIMRIEEWPEENRTIVSFTGIHLAKSTGAALHHAYQGEFDFAYSERDDLLRANWER